MSDNRKNLKDGFYKIRDQYIKKAGQNTKELYTLMSDAAKSSLRACSEKLTDTIQPIVEKRLGNAGAFDTARPETGSVQARRELTKELERAVWRTYYAEGGYRFFAQHVVDYANRMLDRTQSVEEAWIGGYNSNIQPMLTRMLKLERTMAALRSEYDQEPHPLENEELLSLMRAFAARAKADRLDQNTDWERAAYIQAVRLYAQDLDERLLKPYPLLKENEKGE